MSAQHTTLIQASPEEIAALVAAEVQRLGLSAEPVWVNADELASRLGVSKRQIELLAFHGKIPHIDLAMPGSERRMLRFSLQAVQRVIAGAAQEGNAQHDGAQPALVRP